MRLHDAELMPNSLCKTDFSNYIVFQAGLALDNDSPLCAALLEKGSQIQTLSIQVDPKQQAEQIRSAIVGSVPPSLLSQVQLFETLPIFVEERTYVIVGRSDEDEIRKIAGEHGIDMIELTQIEVNGLIEFTTQIQ